MGRVGYPAGGWAFDTFSHITAEKLGDASQDSLHSSFELEHGYTDRLSLEAGVKTTTARRDRLQLSRGMLEASYRFLDNPVKSSVFVEYLPSLRRESEEFEAGFEALKNYGPWLLSLLYQAEIEKEAGRRREVGSELIIGPSYRLGLRGLLGAQWRYADNGAHALNLVLGGTVGERVFLAIQPAIGLTRQAPDMKLMLELHALFGPLPVGGWGLD